MRKNYGNKKFDAFETLQCSPCYALLISFVETDSNDLTATLTTKPFPLTFYVSDEYLFSEKIKYQSYLCLIVISIITDDKMSSISTGIKELDDMLNGGIPKGRIVLISGSSGTGKTTLGMQFIYNGIKKFNEPGVFITLEQDKKKILEDMKPVGMDLEGLGNDFNIIGGPMAEVMYYKDKTKAKIEDFIAEIEEIIKKTNAKRVVIDSINLLLMLFQTDEERRKALLSLNQILSKNDCTALLTCEVRENTFDLSWYGFEEFVVDGVITLYNVKQEAVFHQGIAVRKMRGVEHTKNIFLYKITDKGIKIYPDEPWLSTEKEEK